MAFSNKIELSDFSGGLISDLEAAKLPASAASTLQNADIRNKFLQTLPGVTEVNDGFPAGFVKISEEQFLFTSPSEEEITITYGTLSGAHKLYVRPYLNSSGTFVDALQDLTENEGNYTADAGTNTTTVVDAALLSSTDDYYNKWIFYNITRRAGAIVTDYVGSTKTLTISWAITGQTTGDTYFITRNNIFDLDYAQTPITKRNLFNPDSNGVRFQARDNAIAIVTGSDYPFDFSNANRKADFWLGVLNGYEAFDDTNLNFTGLWLTPRTPLKFLNNNLSFSLTEAAKDAGEVEMPAPTSGYYIVLSTFVYDGYQESALDAGSIRQSMEAPDGTVYAYNVGIVVPISTTGKKIGITVTMNYADDTLSSSINRVETGMPETNTKGENASVIFDRRITAIKVYVAEAQTIDGSITYVKPASEFRLCSELKIDSALWSGSGPSYTQTAYITGDKWAAGAGIDITDRQGHTALNVHANASLIASAKNRVAVANVYADEKRQSFVFFSAVTSDEQNTPDVTPHTLFVDLSLYGIPKIVGFVEALGFWICLGENQLVKIDAATLAVDKNIQARGVSSINAVVNANGLLYFCDLTDIFYYHASQDTIRSIATGFIREAWRGLSTASKQAAAIGYDKRFEMLVVAAGSTIFTYNLPAAYASDLAQDTQAVGSWQVYSVNKTFTKFHTDLTGRCIGLANDGKTYELFSSGVANTLTFEKVLGEGDLNIHTLRLTYEATATVTAKIFDKTRSDTYPIRTFLFPAQSKHKRFDHHKGAHVKRPLLQISAPVGTKISEIVINPDSLTDLK